MHTDVFNEVVRRCRAQETSIVWEGKEEKWSRDVDNNRWGETFEITSKDFECDLVRRRTRAVAIHKWLHRKNEQVIVDSSTRDMLKLPSQK
jgi:hypothetical protein